MPDNGTITIVLSREDAARVAEMLREYILERTYLPATSPNGKAFYNLLEQLEESEL